MNYWGAAIPGLAMAAAELPQVEGLLRLENPEIGEGVSIGSSYKLEEVAEIHLATLCEYFSSDAELTVIGMSMGAMIAAILAGDLREKLPKRTQFRFVSASANTVENPAAPNSLIEEWAGVKAGDAESFRPLLEPFFSKKFRSDHPERFEEFLRYRASGENKQSLKSFRRQTAALRAFDGEQHFSRINPVEARLIHGAEDRIFGTPHVSDLRRILPAAKHQEIPSAGHMLHLEAPHLWQLPDVVIASDDRTLGHR